MNAKSSEEKVIETPQENAEEKKSCSGACRPHTSFYLSVVAILLAAYAAIAAGKGPAVPTDAEARISSLESTVQGLNEQIATLGKDVESNRDNLIQNQLKKALLNIQEVSGLAKDEAKAAIAQAEKILTDLTSAAKPETTAPAEEAAPETTPEAGADAPAEAAPAETPAEAPAESPVAEPAQPGAQAF